MQMGAFAKDRNTFPFAYNTTVSDGDIAAW